MKTNGHTTLRITRLTLENWRNFTRVRVPLAARAFLVGPNASGKSNLLDAIRFLHDLVAVGGGFQHAVQKRGGVSSLRCLAARRYSDIMLECALGDDTNQEQWTYTLSFSQDNKQRPTLKKEKVRRGEDLLLERPEQDEINDSETLTQTNLEQVKANKEFRAVAEFFSSVRYLHIVPQLVREPDRSVGRSNDPYGGDFLEQIARTPENTRKARLRKILDALKVAVPQLQELELQSDLRGTPHLRGKYVHWRPQGAWQNETAFSDGTLRLLGLLWSVLDGSGPLLLEEPELSLHTEVVRYLPQLFARVQRRSGRQLLISSHSTDLLRDSGIGLHEVLLLLPGTEGTVVRAAREFEEIIALLQDGIPLAEAVLPRTRPDGASQLSFFADK